MRILGGLAASDAVDTGMTGTTWILGVVIALITIGTAYHKWYKSQIARHVAEEIACARAVEDRAVLYQIRKELHPDDGGDSMRDAIDRLESIVVAMSDEHRTIAQNHQSMGDRVDWIYRHITEAGDTQGLPEES